MLTINFARSSRSSRPTCPLRYRWKNNISFSIRVPKCDWWLLWQRIVYIKYRKIKFYEKFTESLTDICLKRIMYSEAPLAVSLYRRQYYLLFRSLIHRPASFLPKSEVYRVVRLGSVRVVSSMYRFFFYFSSARFGSVKNLNTSSDLECVFSLFFYRYEQFFQLRHIKKPYYSLHSLYKCRLNIKFDLQH